MIIFKKYIYSFFTVLLFSLAIFAQEKPPDFQTVQTAKGLMVSVNNKAQAYSLLIAGQNSSARQNDDGSLQITSENNSS